MIILYKKKKMRIYSFLLIYNVLLLFLLSPGIAFCDAVVPELPLVVEIVPPELPLVVEIAMSELEFDKLDFLRNAVLNSLQSLEIINEDLPSVINSLGIIHNNLPTYSVEISQIPLDSGLPLTMEQLGYGIDLFPQTIGLLNNISINDTQILYQPIMSISDHEQFVTNFNPFKENAQNILQFVEINGQNFSDVPTLSQLCNLSIEWGRLLKNDPDIDLAQSHINLSMHLYNDILCLIEHDFIPNGN